MLTFCLLIIFFGLVSLHCYTRLTRKGRLADKIPGPSAYPIVGTLLSLDYSTPEALWKLGADLCNTYHPIAKVWFTTSPLFLCSHPDDIEVLLSNTKAFEKGWIYDAFHPWLKTGLFTSSGKKWKQRRKILSPTFHFNIIDKYLVSTEKYGSNFVKNLRAEGKETTKCLLPLFSRMALEIISEVVVGIDVDNHDENGLNEYFHAIHEFGALLAYRLPRPYIFNWMFKYLPFLKISRDINKCIEALHRFSDKIIRERRQYHQKTNYKYIQGFSDDDQSTYGQKKKLAMLDILLLSERDGLIDEEGVEEEVSTFILGGNDTVSSAMLFTIMLLAEHKDIQNTARAEVTEIMDQNNGKLKIEQIRELPYIERCIKEALRLYPPGGIIFRRTPDDSDLQLKHAVLPAGSNVCVHFYCTHRNPKFWPEPDKFDPDRFLPDRSRGRHPYSYIPFSAGPRNCLGQKFAISEMKCLIGLILYNFYLEPIDRLADIIISGNITIRPHKPVYAKFIRIDKNEL